MTTAPPDVRRLIGFRAHGAARLVLHGHAVLEDVEGSMRAGQVETAVLAAHELVQISLSIRGLAVAGDLTMPYGQLSFDPFAGVPAEEVEQAQRLAARGLEGCDVRWYEDLRAHLSETETRLGFAEPLPYVRSGEGMFKALGLVRSWAAHLEELGLPGMLPGDWAQAGD